MRVVEPNPKDWKLRCSVDKNGRVTVHSGYQGGWHSDNAMWQLQNRSLDPHISFRADNVIFEAEIIPVSFSRGRSSVTYRWDDTQDHHTYETGPKFMLAIAKGIVEKKLEVRYGSGIFGYWTFAKQGSQVYLEPYLKIA